MTGLRCAVGVLVLMLALTACRFDGVSSLPLPGTVGTGAGAYAIEVELPDVGTLKPNAQVKVDDIAVGTVTALRTRDWVAVAEVSLGPDVTLPANAVAAVGQNSLLGATYLEMGPPLDVAPFGALADGDVVPLARTRAYPTTEQVLASVSVVLNGGGLNQLSTITRELDRALGGEDGAVGRLLPQLDTLVTGLDAQRGDIVTALDGLDRLSGELAGETEVIGAALDQLGPAFAVLNAEREDLIATLAALRDLSDTGSEVVDASGADLTANLRDLEPVLKSVADAQDQLVGALGIALTFPFPSATVPNACRGDFCNLSLTLDLQLSTLDANLLAGTPLEGSLFGVEQLLGADAPGLAGGVADPLRDPLRPPVPDVDGTAEPDPPDDGGGLLGLLPGGDR